MKQSKIDLLIELIKDYRIDEFLYLIGDYQIKPNVSIDGFAEQECLLVECSGLVFDLSSDVANTYNSKCCDKSINVFGNLLDSDYMYTNLYNACDDLKNTVVFTFDSACGAWLCRHYTYSFSNEEMKKLTQYAKSLGLNFEVPVYNTEYNDLGEILCHTVSGRYIMSKPTLEFFQCVQKVINSISGDPYVQ